MLQKMAVLYLIACLCSVLNKIQKMVNYNVRVKVIQSHGFVLQM